jgi:hypothetical protein
LNSYNFYYLLIDLSSFTPLIYPLLLNTSSRPKSFASTGGPNPNRTSAVRPPMSDRAAAHPTLAPVFLLCSLPRNARSAPRPNPSLRIYRPCAVTVADGGGDALFCPVRCFRPDPVCGADGVTYRCNANPRTSPARCSQSRGPWILCRPGCFPAAGRAKRQLRQEEEVRPLPLFLSLYNDSPLLARCVRSAPAHLSFAESGGKRRTRMRASAAAARSPSASSCKSPLLFKVSRLLHCFLATIHVWCFTIGWAGLDPYI